MLKNRYFVDIVATVMFFTRIPIKWNFFSDKAPDLTRAAWAFPLVGYLIGILSGIFGDICLFLGLPTLLSCIIAIVFGIMITGAIHEDGLADMADGFGVSGTPERVNQIMHDSRLGTYGVIALILGLLIRLGLMVSLVDLGYSLVVILSAGVASGKLAIILLRNLFNPSEFAKTGGLFELVSPFNLFFATLIWIIPVTIIFPFFGVLLGAIFSLAVIYLIGLSAKNYLGGITGDILGATAFISELAFLFGVSIIISGLV